MERSTLHSRHLKITLLALAAVLFAGVSSLAFAQDYTVVKQKDIPYIEGTTNTHQMLDIYSPAELTNAPVLFFSYGAGWTEDGSSDRSSYNAFGTTMAGYYGFTTLVVDCRMAPEVVFPGFIEDLSAALAWTVDNIEDFGGNPGNIFLVGHSSGAHMVALMGTDNEYLDPYGLTSNAFSGVIAMSGVYNLNRIPAIYNDMLTAGFGSLDPDVLAEASPATYATSRLRPFLLLYAETDMPGCTNQAIGFSLRLRAHGNEASAEMLPGVSHVTEIAHLTPDEPDLITATTIADFVEAHPR